MKIAVQWVLKAMLAGILAILIASAGCLVYYNVGIYTTNETGVTDLVLPNNYFACRMTEGIAWDYTDNNGFYNKTSIDKNMDILVMGSSHMEGANVLGKQKTSYLLGELTNKTTYNIGTGRHDFLVCVKNLENALRVMQPTDYVIIEISKTDYTDEAINDCLSGNMASFTIQRDSDLWIYIKKLQYLNLAYAQFKSWKNTNTDTVTNTNHTENTVSEECYSKLLQYIQEICTTYKIQPIIFYHPRLALNPNGTVTANKDTASLEIFATACQTNDVIFIDMTDDFIDMYNKDFVLPHGFCNTSVGEGHLNKYGHRAIAERLAKTISDNAGSTKEKKQ